MKTESESLIKKIESLLTAINLRLEIETSNAEKSNLINKRFRLGIILDDLKWLKNQ